MTTLEKIVKEAKEIRKNYPKKYAKWTDYIKESSQKLKGTFAKKKSKLGLKKEPLNTYIQRAKFLKTISLGATKKNKMKKKPIKYNDVSKRQSDLIRKEIKSKKFIMPHGYEVRRSKLGALMSISDNAKQLLIDCIDLSGYELNITNPMNKIRAVEKIFYTEYGFMINRVGKLKALTEWLQGLPSVLTIPFYNVEIIEIAKKWGSLKMNATEKQEDKILLNYWRYMANQLLQLFNKNKFNTKFT